MSEGNTYDPGALTAQQLAAFAMYGPSVANVYKENFLPLSSDAAKYNAQSYGKYAPGMNRVGRQIYNENATNQLNLDNRLLNSPAAGQLTTRALNLQKQVDPEYFAGRGVSLDALKNLYSKSGSLNLMPESGDLLSGSDYASIERGLNRDNAATGNDVPGSAISTAANAMTYGEAGRKRQMENVAANNSRINTLSQAISSGASMLPTFKSGLDPYKMVTGKPATSNFGDKSFSGNDGNNFGSTVFGQYGNFGTTSQTNTANNKTSTMSQLPDYS